MRESARTLILVAALLPGLAAARPNLPQPPKPPNPTPNTLTVSKSGSGTGFVRSLQAGPTGAPLGIECGTKCSNAYSPGVRVKLRAEPATGVFMGWSGDCSGTGDCEVAMTGARNVTARFEMPTVEVVKHGDLTAAVVKGDYLGPGGQIDCGPKCRIQVPLGTKMRFSASGLRAGYVMSWVGSEAEMSDVMRGASKPVHTVKLGAEPSVRITVSSPQMTVTSMPAGIRTSGIGTWSHAFTPGTNLTLTNEYANAIWRCQNRLGTGVLCEVRAGLPCTFTAPPDTPVAGTGRPP
jgi:hypothetical protein